MVCQKLVMNACDKMKLKVSRLMMIEAWMILFAWLLVIFFVLSVLSLYFFYDALQPLSSYVEGTIVIRFIWGMVCYDIFVIFLGMFLKCGYCDKQIYREPNVVHRNFTSVLSFSPWASVAINTFWNRRFICMHCGRLHSRPLRKGSKNQPE